MSKCPPIIKHIWQKDCKIKLFKVENQVYFQSFQELKSHLFLIFFKVAFISLIVVLHFIIEEQVKNLSKKLKMKRH